MKTVLVTQRVDSVGSYKESRDALDQRYISYISSMGFLPYIVPNSLKIVNHIIDTVEASGLVLTGGNDLSEYGGDAPERDQVEKKLIDIFVKKNLPVLGICRGAQILACHCAGGRLSKVKGHINTHHEISGTINKVVNSFHSWSINSLDNENFFTLAKDSNGYVEAFSSFNNPILGVMWHPEREDNIDLLERFKFKNFLDSGDFL